MTDSVTVSLLPVSLSLVHVPRARLDALSQHVLRQLLHPAPTFLNVTCNEIELSLFAERDALRDLQRIARRDAHKARRRKDPPPDDPPLAATGDPPRRRRASREWEPVEASADSWSVLQIDSHSGLDTSGARVHELSAPLAAAGISILYQSSYMCDYIFVKTYRLSEVMSLLGAAGFDLYSSDPQLLTASLSALPSPALSPTTAADPDAALALDLGAVLSRSRSNTTTTPSSPPAPAPMSSPADFAFAADDLEGPPAPAPRAPSRAHSHSPAGGDVRVLAPDLTYVGLADDSADVWALKLVKLVAFPELIPAHASARASPPPSPRAPAPPSPLALAPVGQPAPLPVRVLADEGSGSDTTTRVGCESPKALSPPRAPFADVFDSGSSSSSGDESAADELERAPARPALRRLDTQRARADSGASLAAPPPAVPFFSFTRTAEGASLTAPVALLAALFPPSERHMVICSDELDVLDACNPHGAREDAQDGGAQGPLRCLQIDLRKFGLDKHGLVSRYARTLEENGINHMYSSTYKTANLLVDRAHAGRAQALLRAC